ncbi:putative poly(ADP)-ribose polymerase PARP [Aspergillus saccharolyticus JOP 1030-1]|uniref:Poly [ADP-ribose] polymerase n=1 Tax=Aspergillus saccharolyticus JOP 1030-1 TaxID=1450539 RepID=A0A318Z2W6_9EURO|nr:poly polymerase [Aspergillus saccharolyticus JOP 1030-1]PYH40704.1 poly polymerase [Aspergillus saccharolyticus JOP 1030-1]
MTKLPFDGLVIAVGGTFPGYRQSDLNSIIKRLGGEVSAAITEQLTHLISTPKDVANKSRKYTQACKVPYCNIVSLDWLLDSETAGKRLAEKDFLLGTADSKGQSDGEADEGTKKKRTLEQALGVNEDGTSKKLKNAQKAGTKPLNIPVDDECPLRGSHQVYIDPDATIWDATLNQTSSTNNNNKFYRIQLLTNRSKTAFKTWTHWGRVGESGQHALLGDGSYARAEAEFKKKFKDKSGLTWENRLEAPKNNKYTFIERNYEEGSDSDSEDEAATAQKRAQKQSTGEVKSALPVQVQDLMAFIFNQEFFLSTMAAMSYDAQKLPLGKLSKRTLRAGFQALKDLSELVADPALAASKYGMTFQAAAEGLSNRYFTTIPHVFGRNRPPVLTHGDLLKKEIELLETLTDMEVANNIMKDAEDAEMIHHLDKQFQGLGMNEMTPLARDSTEFAELETYLVRSRGATHGVGLKVLNIFRIERQGEEDRFNSSRFAQLKNSDRRLLWHGSRSTNFGGILSQGLRIAPPEAPVNGYMFGKGVYLADMSSKSANYCCASGSGGKGLLLLCDAELGDPMLELEHGNFHAGEDAAKQGKIATLGRGRSIPGGWKDAGCVHPNLRGVKMPDSAHGAAVATAASLMYNEYIVYDVAQIRQRYLFHVDMR